MQFPPGPRNRYPFDLTAQMISDPLRLLSGLARRYGDVVHFRLGFHSVFLINHPDYVREVLLTQQKNFKKGRALERAKLLLGEGLLTSEGETHLRQRRLAQPAFTKQKIPTYASKIIEKAKATSQRWEDGQTIDMRREMMQLTLQISVDTFFGPDLKMNTDEIGEAMEVSSALFRTIFLPLSDLWLKLPVFPFVKKFMEARQHLDTVILDWIKIRRAENIDRGDLFSTLLLATDTEGDGGGMTNEQLRDELLTLLLASHETTANALSWSWYLLAKNPDCAALLHAEAVQIFGNREPTFEDVGNLTYARKVFSESLRLYPPAWGTGRRAMTDTKLGGYVIPEGALVLASQYVLQRDSRFFDNPNAFDPERWTPEQISRRPRFSYFPFGAGVRQCIGESFAWMEGTLVLAILAREWRPELLGNEEIGTQAQITLRPKHGIKMGLKKMGNF
jgi:cytochrome P450